MHPQLAADLGRLPELLEETRQHALAFLEGLDERPVVERAEPPAAAPLTEEGGGTRAALAEFTERWEPRLSASPGPRYFGFVTGG
ncbi:aspartate aminotransferase family protein, partial [Kitasatospora sp. NPDC057512]